MKTTFLFITLFIGFECFSQYAIEQISITSDLIYPELDKKTIENPDSTYRLQILSKDGQPILTGALNSIDPEIREGSFTFFAPDNKPIAMGKYYQGYPSGLWRYFKADGQLDQALDYNSTIQFLNDRSNIELDEPPLVLTDNMPTFEGGDGNDFMSFLKQNAVYPISSIINKTQGRVFVQITIDKEGKIVNPEILRDGLDIDINMEVYRILSIAPNWIPGTDKKGRPKNIVFTLPLNFELPQ